MPTGEQIRQFLTGVVLPVGVGIAAAWIVATVHILNLFGITEGQVAGELTLFGTWAVTAVVTWLTQHHILKGIYAPAPVAAEKAAATARQGG
jgi:hypothetical protein